MNNEDRVAKQMDTYRNNRTPQRRHGEGSAGATAVVAILFVLCIGVILAVI